MEQKYLVMVTAANNNKFYRMIPNGDGTWTAEYGRIGASCQKKTYPEKDFWKKYEEKIRKGYSDQTELHQMVVEQVEQDAGYKEISDDSIRRIVDMIMGWAARTVKENYTVSSDSVTQEAVDKAQHILNGLIGITDVNMFNSQLKRLFETIPRRMSNVSDHIASSSSDFRKIIDYEQALLDAMSGQVAPRRIREVVKKEAGTQPRDVTVLEQNGLEFVPCADEELENIRRHLDHKTRDKFKNAWKVWNRETYDRFEAYCRKNGIEKPGIKFYYHGSRNQNYWNILVQGLKLRPTQNVQRSGAMFGYGLYFAPKAAKSVNYTSINGAYWSGGHEASSVLLVFKVAEGKRKDVDSWSPEISAWTEKDCRAEGFDSVYAHAGKDLRNDEVIVYNEDACTVQYLIELEA